MTNREKFKEVFGYTITKQIDICKYIAHSPNNCSGVCDRCDAYDWANKEYINNSEDKEYKNNNEEDSCSFKCDAYDKYDSIELCKAIYDSETPCKLVYVFSASNRFGVLCRDIDDVIKIVPGSIEGKGCLIVTDKNHVIYYIMLDSLLYFNITIKDVDNKEE